MQFKPVTAIAVLLLVVASLLVSGCTTSTTSNTNQTPSASTATARDYAQNYLNVTISSLSKNETLANQKIVDNGTDTVMLSYAITNKTSQPILYTNGFTTTFGLNVKRFSSVNEATRFYEQTSLGFTPYQPTLNASIYKTTTGHNPTINNESRRLNSITQASIATQQDEFVVWGTASIMPNSSTATTTPTPTQLVATITPTSTPTATPTSTPVPTAIGFDAVPVMAFSNQPTAVTAGIRAGGGSLCTNGLTVSMFVDGTYVGQVVTTSCDGEFVFTYPGLPAGTHSLTASFAGNGQYAPSSGYHALYVSN